MGEIGIDRNTFFYELRWWEVQAIIRGYNNRHRNLWSATRWQTFRLMEAQVGTEAMHKAHLFKPDDLLQFPWDRKPAPPLTDAERDELQAEMDALNRAAAESQS